MDEVRELRARITQLLLSGEGTEDLTSGTEDLTSLMDRLDDRKAHLRRLGPDFLPIGRGSVTDVREIQSALAAQTVRSAILEFREYLLSSADGPQATRWAGLLVTKDTLEIRDLGTVGDSTPHVEAMLTNANTTESRSAGGALYQNLLQPFSNELHEVERIYIAPDGDLYLVPFGVLKQPNGKRLLQVKDVRILLSSRDLLRRPPPQTARGLVAVGGIDFDVISQAGDRNGATSEEAALRQMQSEVAKIWRSGFRSLPGTRIEAQMISELYRASRDEEVIQVVTDGSPTKSWLMSLPPPRVLHLATHGFYRRLDKSSDWPSMLTGIALAGANRSLGGGGNNGILYAPEAQDLNLEGTELVVLSACDTAQGSIDYADGISGLVRSLRTAGARYVMAAVRPIDDNSTAEFMQLFYQRLARQPDGASDPPAALREAQLLLSQGAKSGDATWTGFLLVGP